MSQQTSPTTPKQSYAAAVARPAAVTNAPHSGICTRAMANKMTLNAAAASLHAAKVPTKPRTYTVSSIMAAASAIIARTSPPNTKAASPKMIEVPKSSYTTSVLTVGASTMDEQMQEMRRMLERLLKDNEEKNKKIEDLQKEVVSLGKQKLDETASVIRPEDNDSNKMTTAEIIKADGACNENQLEVLIANVVKSQLTGNPSGGARYTKPYSKRIDILRMPQGYQPPKFQQFDGKGNPKQHVAHFVETCSNAGTEGDLLVKQFVRSLKGIAFDWYTDLDAESIDSWERMEDEFFNRFYSTRRTVSMSELTNTKQWDEEPVVDYINRWRTLCLECKDRISETSAVEMCIDGMSWELLYILKGNKPRSFQELATRAHDMEITVNGRRKSHSTSLKAFVEKNEYKGPEKVIKSTPKEAMAIGITNTPVKIHAKPKQEKRKEVAAEDYKRTRPTLKELQGKKYPFPDSDLSAMLDDLLKKGIIKLPEAKRPDEVNKVNDPKYCRYHRLVSHNIENCITLKELIMRLAQEGTIVLDADETVEANHMSVSTCGTLPDKFKAWSVKKIQFGTMVPVKVWMSKPHAASEPKKLTGSVAPKRNSTFDLKKKVRHRQEDDDGWTLETRRKTRKQILPQPPELVYRKKKRVIKKRPRQARGKKESKKDVKSQVLSIDLLEQVPPVPITLGDFFPKDYPNKVAVNATSGAYKIVDQDGLRVGPINERFLKRYHC